MSELITVAFDEVDTAEEARRDLLRLKGKERTDLEEAIVIEIGKDGEPRLHHQEQFTVPAALAGGFVGTLVGLILMNPLFAAIGGITGTAWATAFGALKKVGISEDFIKKLAQDLQPGASALFIVTRRSRPRMIVEALQSYQGKLLQTSLSHPDEGKLREALQKVNASG